MKKYKVGIIGATGMIMIFLGGANLAWLIGMGVCGVGGVVGLIFLLPHAMARVKVWLDPFSDFRGNGFEKFFGIFLFSAVMRDL